MGSVCDDCDDNDVNAGSIEEEIRWTRQDCDEILMKDLLEWFQDIDGDGYGDINNNNFVYSEYEYVDNLDCDDTNVFVSQTQRFAMDSIMIVTAVLTKVQLQ